MGVFNENPAEKSFYLLCNHTGDWSNLNRWSAPVYDRNMLRCRISVANQSGGRHLMAKMNAAGRWGGKSRSCGNTPRLVGCLPRTILLIYRKNQFIRRKSGLGNSYWKYFQVVLIPLYENCMKSPIFQRSSPNYTSISILSLTAWPPCLSVLKSLFPLFPLLVVA